MILHYAHLTGTGLRIAVLVHGDGVPEAGTLGDDFFAGLRLVSRSGAPDMIAPLTDPRVTEGCDAICVVDNSNCQLSLDLLDRIAAAVGRMNAAGPWAVAAAKGVEATGQHHSVLYCSQDPSLFITRDPQAIVDAAPDLVVINAAFLREAADALQSLAVPFANAVQWMILEGWLGGRASAFVPELAVGIYGHALDRDAALHAEFILDSFGTRVNDQSVMSMTGPLRLAARPRTGDRPELLRPRLSLNDAITATAARLSAPMTLSIVTRTTFSRPHLLGRLLTTLSRSRREDVQVEVVLSTDIDRATAEAAVAALRQDFPYVALKLQVNEKTGHSRVTNLIGGMRAASLDYVAVIDDDDYIHADALEALVATRFMGGQPLVVMGSEKRKETWSPTPSGRWVLSASVADGGYPAEGWTRMFGGVNRLPVCALIMPRDWLVSHLARFEFNHDLSEDYTLFLLLLTANDLPHIREVPQTFCMISIRGDQSNTVTAEDRSGWVRDISAYLADLFLFNPQSGAGVAQLLARNVAPVPHEPKPTRELMRLREDVRCQRQELAYLRAQLAAAQTPKKTKG